MGPGLFVRPARADDVATMVALAVAAWRTAWHGRIPPDQLGADRAAMEQAWRDAIVDPPTPAHRVFVATDNGQVFGYAAVAPADDPDVVDVPGVLDIVDLVVAPPAQRQGHGSRLLHACADHARDSGASTLVTWCALEDEPRRAFLQSNGFGPDGAMRTLASEDEAITVAQVRLATSVVEA